MKELKSLQIEHFKNSLIKLKSDLIEKIKKNNIEQKKQIKDIISMKRISVMS